MNHLIPHPCPPGRYCGLCNHNAKCGGAVNHPSNLVRPKVPATPATVRKPLPVRGPCLHLGRQLSPTDRAPCSRTYECEKGHGAVCPRRECRTCPDHEPEG